MSEHYHGSFEYLREALERAEGMSNDDTLPVGNRYPLTFGTLAEAVAIYLRNSNR